MCVNLKIGDIVEKDGKQFEYLGDGNLREVDRLAKRFIDGAGEFKLHHGQADMSRPLGRADSAA